MDRIILADWSSACSPLTSPSRAAGGRVSLQDQFTHQLPDACCALPGTT